MVVNSCVCFHGIRLICDDLHRLATYRLLSPKSCALCHCLTMQGKCKANAERARSSYAEPQPSLALATCLRVQSYI